MVSAKRTCSCGANGQAKGDILPLEIIVRYKIALVETDEGYSVSVPGLPGCWSQGASEDEALENIASAIREYVAVRDELLDDATVREIEVVI